MSDIDPAAVEAVARLLYEQHGAEMGYPDETGDGWEKESAEYRATWVDVARPLLAAALPHLRRSLAEENEARLQQLAEDLQTVLPILSDIARHGFSDDRGPAGRLVRFAAARVVRGDDR